MQHERVAERVYFFQSEIYAQVTAGIVAGPDMAVLIDTLVPEESLQIKQFAERELQVPIRYVINTHYHADHSWGNAVFPEALIVAHAKCFELQEERGIPSFEQEQAKNPQLAELSLRLPQITFDEGTLKLEVGKKLLQLIHLPGHSPDNIGVLIEEDRVLFAGDTFMPLPFLVDGDIDEMFSSLKQIAKMGLENLVPGHGDIILRGEVDGALKGSQDYLSRIRKEVRKAGRLKYPLDHLENVTVEDAGKSRVLIGGLAEQLHRNNLTALYRHYYKQSPQGSEFSYS